MTPRVLQLRAKRTELVAFLRSRGLTNIRVFGSVSTGTDRDGSDVDLLVTACRPLGLLERAGVEIEASEILGLPVDLVFDDAIRPDLRDGILAAAVPL